MTLYKYTDTLYVWSTVWQLTARTNGDRKWIRVERKFGFLNNHMYSIEYTEYYSEVEFIQIQCYVESYMRYFLTPSMCRE